MKQFFTLCTLFLSLMLFSACSDEELLVRMESDQFQLTLDRKGHIESLVHKADGKDYLYAETSSPLIQLKIGERILLPIAAELQGSVLSFRFEGGQEIKINYDQHPSHLSFEVLEATPSESIDLLIWGPIATTIDKLIGETIGVARGETFAIGIQALNPKTLGGYPWHEDDATPQLDIFEQDDLSDLSEKNKRMTLYRVEAAKPEDYGSSLQAYTRNRFEQRVIPSMDHERYTAPAYEDGGIIGSKIALFGCAVEQTLETIGKIELAEDLPHPQIDGEWGKTAKGAAAAYLIYDFTEETIDQAIQFTKQAGLRYVYHPGPFKNWGHFDLQESAFPRGWDGLKACVARAEREGIHVGVHTLSNFITTNDPYVTPIPDERLGEVGKSNLSRAINATETSIELEAPDFFNQFKNNHLKTVKIGTELIRYETISESAPWTLLNCERGAWGTAASGHEVGASISKLADHGYKVFLTQPALSIEMAERLAELYRYTGLRQISFDGLEGNRSTGMGNYGEILFTTTWYNNLNDSIRSHLITDASRTTHYFWHIYSRMNWGEPWYAGFRESQTEYRLKNQAYFQRNLMPGMLGWFSMRANTPLEDVEWMLARSAAFDAGYAFVVNEESLMKNGQRDAILEQIGTWEKIRMAGGFSEAQKERMKGIENEFQLIKTGENNWNLHQIHVTRFTHEAKVRQPGEPLFTTHRFPNPVANSTLHFILRAEDASISSIKLELNNSRTILLPVRLNKGQSLRYSGGSYAELLDQSLNLLERVPIEASDFQLAEGEQSITVDASFSDSGEHPLLKVETRIQDLAEAIKL